MYANFRKVFDTVYHEIFMVLYYYIYFMVVTLKKFFFQVAFLQRLVCRRDLIVVHGLSSLSLCLLKSLDVIIAVTTFFQGLQPAREEILILTKINLLFGCKKYEWNSFVFPFRE